MMEAAEGIDPAIERIFQKRQVGAFEDPQVDKMGHDQQQTQQESQNSQADPGGFLDVDAVARRFDERR